MHATWNARSATLANDGTPTGLRREALRQATEDTERRLARLVLKTEREDPPLEAADVDRLATLLSLKIRDLRIQLDAIDKTMAGRPRATTQAATLRVSPAGLRRSLGRLKGRFGERP